LVAIFGLKIASFAALGWPSLAVLESHFSVKNSRFGGFKLAKLGHFWYLFFAFKMADLVA